MTRPRRDAPEDFARVAPTMTIRALSAHYAAGPVTVARWLAEMAGHREPLFARPSKPCPPDFATHAAVENNTALMKRYTCASKTLARWRRETGVPAPRASGWQHACKKPVPQGFSHIAPQMSRSELRVRYCVSIDVIDRWCRDEGVRARTAIGASGRKLNPVAVVWRDSSCAGQAADYLRKFGAVVRCDAAGHYSPDGDHWRRGSAVLCADEIIARAIRNGWQPDAWKLVA